MRISQLAEYDRSQYEYLFILLESALSWLPTCKYTDCFHPVWMFHIGFEQHTLVH